MNNKQVLSALLTVIMVISITASTATGAGICGTGDGTWYTTLITAQTPSCLMLDSFLYSKPLPPTSSTTVTLTAVADATVKSWQPGSNFGSESVLELSYSAIDEAREAVTLLRFDVASALPEGAIIDSASLELFLADGSGADPALVAAYFVTSSWTESNVTWNSFPTAEPIGVILQVDGSPGSYKSWQVTSFVQEWQSGSNDGVYLRGPVDGTYYGRTFESREPIESVPRLVVTYHLPSPTYTFTGNVYQGSPPETDTPVGGVTVELWGDEDEWPEAEFERVLLTSTATGDAGAFSLSWEPGDAHYPYLHVIEVDPPGAYSTDAQAEAPGYAKNFNVVSYPDIPPGTYNGIAFWDQLPEELPDLVIADVRNEADGICYRVENIGDGVAPGGHCTALSIDGVYRVEDCVDVDLEPGVDMVRCFEYDWECTHPDDAVVVCADHRGAVEERDEDNNCLELVFECLPAELPDIVVTDLWNEEGRICYQIMNIGDGVAHGGHCTALIIDGEYMVSDPVDQELEPGERLRGCFDYDWECTSPEDLVVVVADYEGGVAEDNETNNPREEVWKCDIIPPRIVHGPIVQEVTWESAVIFWETDEDSDGVVKYGKASERYDLEEGDSAVVIEHSITLSRLEPSTTYNFVAQSTDASGNTVKSSDITLETLSVQDDEDPSVVIVDPGMCQGIVTIEAEAEDNVGVEKVEFFMADELVFTDYSPPYELTLDTDKYKNGEYMLKAKTTDLFGRSFIDERIIGLLNAIDVTIPSVNITSPNQWDTVSGTITVKALVSDDEGLSHGYFWVGPDPKMHYASWYAGYPSPKEATMEMNWNTKGSKNGPLRIAWEMYDKKGNVGWGYQDVIVDNVLPPAPPNLSITNRDVKRDKNCFTISLTVKNVGGQTATSITIWDYLQLFQPIEDSDNVAVYQSEFNPKLMRWKVEIKSKVDIPKGGERTYTYDAVPVLTPESAGPYDSCPYPMIGAYAICGKGWWKWDGETHVQYKKPGGIGYFHEYVNIGKKIPYPSYFGATTEADYLIVTNPDLLFSHNSGHSNEVNALLSDMAKLAKLNKGVLGYLSGSDANAHRNSLKNLVKPGVGWAKANWAYRLHPDFSKPLKGYLLIVGETEIVPAWNVASVHFSDQPYSDTAGNDDRPELTVGRIIGNSPTNLSNAIQTCIGCKFDRSHALTVAGDGGGTDSWAKDANQTADILDDEFSVEKILWKDYPSYAKMLQRFRAMAIGRDVIMYSDHAGPDGWSNVIYTSNFPVNFGNTNPFVFAFCCLSGCYENHPTFNGGDYNIAEAFFDSGTAVYIGSTEETFGGPDNRALNRFYKGWVKTSKSIGTAFVETERDLVAKSNDHYWVREYNLYGDPKIGATTSASTATALGQMALAEEAPSSLEIVVPDYEVTIIDGLDYVEISDGMSLLVEGKPEVPFYSVYLEYPEGYEIQDVLLTDKSGLSTTTGLNIPESSFIVKDNCGEEQDSAEQTTSSWYPEEEYSWQVLENPDGTSTLVIVIYPFNYNPLTTDVRFYKNYSFNINYTVSPVAITTLSMYRDEYQQGDTVMVDIGLNNSGDAQDAIVSASVNRYGSGEAVDGLLLRTLKEFTGLASFTPLWDSSGVEPGYYSVEVSMKDTSGDVLDRKTEMFRLGISSGEIVSFTATPECFDIGDEIGIEMAFGNNGTVNITGTAITRVLNSTGYATEEFRHDVTNLTPSGSVSFSDTWDTSGAEVGSSYTIIGYVLYDSKSTDPATVTVRNLVMSDLNRDGVVTPADAAIALELAASGEWDPAADVNCDEQVTSLDALMILQLAAGAINM